MGFSAGVGCPWERMPWTCVISPLFCLSGPLSQLVNDHRERRNAAIGHLHLAVRIVEASRRERADQAAFTRLDNNRLIVVEALIAVFLRIDRNRDVGTAAVGELDEFPPATCEVIAAAVGGYQGRRLQTC